MKFRLRAIEAIQFTEPNIYGVMCNAWGEQFREHVNFVDGNPDQLIFENDPDHVATIGDWVIFAPTVPSWHPMKDSAFKLIYEPVPLKAKK